MGIFVKLTPFDFITILSVMRNNKSKPLDVEKPTLHEGEVKQPLPTDDEIANHLGIRREVLPPEPASHPDIEQAQTPTPGENKG